MRTICQFGSPLECARVISPRADTALKVGVKADIFGTAKGTAGQAERCRWIHNYLSELVTELHAGAGRRAAVYGNGVLNDTRCTDEAKIVRDISRF